MKTSERVCKPNSRPRMLMCYLCGREYGTRSLPIHIPRCQKKWLLEEETKPEHERRPLPPQPSAHLGDLGSRTAFERFNAEAFAAFEQTLQQCPHCQRRFQPKPFLHHQKGCTAANPAKPAGTGLIAISLTNRLVPGAIAGSLHGKAREQHMPLRLCKPSEESKLKMSRPASARPSHEDDSFSINETNPGKSSSFNVFWGEPQTQKRPPNSRRASHNGIIAGGEKANLEGKFGELWRSSTHSSSSGDEWCSSQVAAAATPLRPKTAAFTTAQYSSSCRQSPRSSSQASPRERKLNQLAPRGSTGHWR